MSSRSLLDHSLTIFLRGFLIKILCLKSGDQIPMKKPSFKGQEILCCKRPKKKKKKFQLMQSSMTKNSKLVLSQESDVSRSHFSLSLSSNSIQYHGSIFYSFTYCILGKNDGLLFVPLGEEKGRKRGKKKVKGGRKGLWRAEYKVVRASFLQKSQQRSLFAMLTLVSSL